MVPSRSLDGSMAMLETQDNLSETEGKEFGCLIQWMKSAVLPIKTIVWESRLAPTSD
jgi:hypothetical protein